MIFEATIIFSMLFVSFITTKSSYNNNHTIIIETLLFEFKQLLENFIAIYKQREIKRVI